MVGNEDSQGVYKLIVIGGGPAGIGVFVRAARLGMLSRLLNPEAHGKPPDLERVRALGKTQKGVAILHDGDASSFGSGNLGAYMINSNTFANSLTSSVLDDKPDMDPPERTVGTFLERARQHASAQRLEEIGAAPACLMDIGNFLHHVGACVMEEMEAIAPTSSKCFLSTKGTRIDILENGLIRVEAQPSDGESFSLLSEHVALATGGEQERPVLDPPHLRSKLFMSDECVRDEGFARLRSLLVDSQVTGGDKAMKVCLVGGSHSAFSVAWLLLNKFRRAQPPSLFRSSADIAGSRNTSPTKTQSFSESISSAPTPLDEPISSPSAVCSAASEGSDSPLGAVLPTVTPSPLPISPSKSESVRKPTGPMPAFKPKDITLLHRTPIRCYYGSRKEAEADGADGSRVDRGGCVNTFTGLREDAKALYNSVRAGKETRVRLFQINRQGSQALSAKAYDSASAIVWCCGYKTRMPQVFDSDNNYVSFLSENGVVKLDNKGRLQLAAPNGLISSATGSSEETSSLQNAVGRIMGLGIGFHLRAPVDEMGGETRADGVTVYHRRGASLVLEALFGSEVYGSSTSFEEMVEKLDKKKRETTAISPTITALGSGASIKPSEPGGSPEKIKRTNKTTNPLVVTGEASGSPNCATSGSATKPRSSVAVSPANKPRSLALQMSASPMRRASTDRPELVPAAITFGGTESPPTNPPVKLLLNRRRQSGEDHSALVAASHHHQAPHRPKIASGPVSSPPRVCRDASLPTALSITSPPAETGA